MGYEKSNIKEIFGSLVNYRERGRIIANINQFKRLIKLCEFPANQKFKLLYRATEDGFNAKNFHKKCDEVKNTLTIIQTTNGNVFGGYTGAAWSSYGGYLNDPTSSSFIFSLKNQLNISFKAECIRNQYSIYCSQSSGPSFGGGCDLFISNDSNVNKESHTSNFGSSYNRSTYDKYILAGSRQF